MKNYNINYEGLSFEEKVKLKLNYLLSLPRTSPEVESAIINLMWVLQEYEKEQIKNKVKIK